MLEKNNLLNFSNKEKTLRKLFSTTLSSLAQNSSQSFNCTVTDANTSDSYKLCIRENSTITNLQNKIAFQVLNLTDKANFPQFDLFSLLKDAIDCKEIISQTTRITSSGILLTPLASVWPNTCRFKNIAPLSSIKIFANIEASLDITLKADAQMGSAEIISPGFIDIQSTLTTQSDLIILAAGDVNVKRLISSSGLRVTIISTKGVINVSEVLGEPQLKLISRSGSKIGGKIFLQNQILLPLMKEMQIIGLF